MVRTVSFGAPQAGRAAARASTRRAAKPAGELEAYSRRWAPRCASLAPRAMAACGEARPLDKLGAATRCWAGSGRRSPGHPGHRRIQVGKGAKALSSGVSRSSRSGGPLPTLRLRRREYQHHGCSAELARALRRPLQALKRDRSGTSRTSELLAREPCRYPRIQERYARPLPARAGGPSSGHNPLQNEILELARAGPTSFGWRRNQSNLRLSPRGVRVFREQRSGRGARASRRSSLELPSRGEVLDAIDMAFGCWGRRV